MKFNLQEFLKNWHHTLITIICSYSFLIALVFSLSFPWKAAVILACLPPALFVLIYIFLFIISRKNISLWREKYIKLRNDENFRVVAKNVILPLGLIALYFYIRNEIDQTSIYTYSDVQVETRVHPCGSSRRIDNNEVWDAADLISQPTENEVYIVTNAVFGVNQRQEVCPQTGAYCTTTNIKPGEIKPKWLKGTSWRFSHEFAEHTVWNPVICDSDSEEGDCTSCPAGVLYDNGIQTGECDGGRFCDILGWCPPISLSNFSATPLFPDTAEFTVFLNMRPNYPSFSGLSWTKGGRNGYGVNYGDTYAQYNQYTKSVETCLFDVDEDPYCPRFKISDIVKVSGANFSNVAGLGGNFKIRINWDCNFDWGRDIYGCLPNFSFLNQQNLEGKPKMKADVSRHEDGSRTVTYSLGITLSIEHTGRGSQIHLVNFILAAQFFYVSYLMVQQPFLWIARFIGATYLTILEVYWSSPTSS